MEQIIEQIILDYRESIKTSSTDRAENQLRWILIKHLEWKIK